LIHAWGRLGIPFATVTMLAELPDADKSPSACRFPFAGPSTNSCLNRPAAEDDLTLCDL
jgi:hypothetical protein